MKKKKSNDSQEQVIAAELTYIISLVEILRSAYPSLPVARRRKMKERVEQLVGELSGEANDLYPSDWDRAKKLREEAGVSRKDLVKELGGSMHEITLYRLESLRLVPNPSRKAQLPYLKWLKKQGYNPFDL